MHELPKDLGQSLRSWRGSLRKSLSVPDLEKGVAEQARRDNESARNTRLNAKSSIITEASVSSEDRDDAPEQQDESLRNSRVQLPPLQMPAETTQGYTYERPRKQATFPPQTAVSTKKSIFAGAPKIADPDPAGERLSRDNEPLTLHQFHELLGIREPTHAHQHPRELVIKGGLYHRIVSRLDRVNFQYRMFDFVAYLLLVVQLVISAVFIVLGALRSSQNGLAIAVLGGVSAVLSGCLALMKGQGLPNRLRQYRDGLRAVAFEAEELYWDVAACAAVYFADIRKIREDYLRIMDVAQRNHPDNWNAFAEQLAQAQAQGHSARPRGGK